MLDQRMQEIPLAVNTVKKSVAGQEYNQNMFVERTLAGKYAFIVRACEGYVSYSNLNAPLAVKGFYTLQNNNRCFAMTGTGIYEIYSNGASVLLSSVVFSGARVECADNGVYLVCVDGLVGYSINLATSAVTQITDPNFYPACTVTEQDSFFIFERTGTKQFFICDAALTFDALDYASANGKADNNVRVKSVSRLLYIFKKKSIEFWYNAGNADFTFQRAEGSFIDHGAFRYTIADISNVLYYVGSDRQVYAMVGYSPAPIGTEPVLNDLLGVDLESAIGLCYQLETHTFYVLTIASINKTWVYDVSTQSWFVRSSSIFGRHVMNHIVTFNNKTLISDFQAGLIYEMTPAAGRDNGDKMIKKFRLPVINTGVARRVCNAFQLDVSVGLGRVTGHDTDPQAILEVSRDDGKTFPVQRTTSLGKIGEYKTIVAWRKLGIATRFTFQITVDADAPGLVVGGAYVALQ